MFLDLVCHAFAAFCSLSLRCVTLRTFDLRFYVTLRSRSFTLHLPLFYVPFVPSRARLPRWFATRSSPRCFTAFLVAPRYVSRCVVRCTLRLLRCYAHYAHYVVRCVVRCVTRSLSLRLRSVDLRLRFVCVFSLRCTRVCTLRL